MRHPCTTDEHVLAVTRSMASHLEMIFFMLGIISSTPIPQTLSLQAHVPKIYENTEAQMRNNNC